MKYLKIVTTEKNGGLVYWYIVFRRQPLEVENFIAKYSELNAEMQEKAKAYLEGCFTEIEYEAFTTLYTSPSDRAAISWRQQYGEELNVVIVELPLQTIPEIVPWHNPGVKLEADDDRSTLHTVADFEKFDYGNLSFRFGCCRNQIGQ